MQLTLQKYQDAFLFSLSRYPAMVSAIGTGKTLMLLLKIWNYCEEYSNSLALIVRKEYTDLRDSSLRDFERYFKAKVNGDKDYKFANGSTIMFRHGDEINVLKNINLSIFGIEQAEEFDTEETFTFLRDRLRRDNAPYRQGCVIANTNGHNWIYKLWKNNPSEGFFLTEANTFENEDNLPADFIQDLRHMERESPNHYRRYVLNSWEDTDEGDLLISFPLIERAIQKNLKGIGQRILACDVARFGDDKTVFTIMQQVTGGWKQIYLYAVNGQDTMATVGRIVDLNRRYSPMSIVVDDIGVGAGVVDRLKELHLPVFPYIASSKPSDLKDKEFVNKRAEDYWRLKELFENGEIQIINDENLITQLSSLKFKYKSSGQKIMESKDEMKKRGLASPDYPDVLMMSISRLPNVVFRKQNIISNQLKQNAGIQF